MKIKSVLTSRLVKIFRRKFHVNQNLQFLLFGQVIPEGGFRPDDEQENLRKNTMKSMKTQELKDLRTEELSRLDDQKQYDKARHMLN